MAKEIIMKFSDGYCLVLNDKGETNLRENDVTELSIVLPPRTCEMLNKIGEMYKELKELKEEKKKFQEKLKDYRDCIKYSTDISKKLGFDELMLLLAECIGDKQVQEETNKYVDDYYKSVKQEDKEFKELHKVIEGLVKWYNRNTTQEQ